MKTAFAGKAVAFLRIFANKIVEISRQLQEFFHNGSFGVAVYPFFMHPLIRGSGHFVVILLAALLSFMGVFYLFAEFVVNLFSESSLISYIQHTVLELLIPFGTIIDGKTNTFSPLSQVMNAIFSLQGLAFVIAYLAVIVQLSRRKYWLLALIFAAFFSIGMSLIPSSQAKITAGGLQNLGASLTYLFGNLAILIAGIDIVKPQLVWLRRFSIQAGTIGVFCVLITIFFPNILTPILERVAIYAIMIWEILAGLAMLKRK
ncbi:permease [Actinobacillus equuli]|uniref:permease n=1 Tax=Actinobacillus equuli TaxID=718 RepID=UPI002443557D|nr:permease [Actinobacillus equuli]WGE58239.1 permease [Actinobacillus equuli subsp. haemolyticus]WGE61164.1 permease [Actinobacillus equuli subsp. haemolyticus]